MTTATMPRCATCVHWSPPDDDDSYRAQFKVLGVRRCRAVPVAWDATMWSPDADDESGYVRVRGPEYDRTTAFVQDGSDYRADLYTMPEHGCTMHKAVPDA